MMDNDSRVIIDWIVVVIDNMIYTVFRKKTPLRFLLYLRGKCLDFHRIFRECLGGN